MIFGSDVTHQAWRTVGRKPWLALLRWTIIRWFSDIAYRIFAKKPVFNFRGYLPDKNAVQRAPQKPQQNLSYKH